MKNISSLIFVTKNTFCCSGKVSIFKPQIGKVFFGQTAGGKNVIFPSKNNKQPQ